MYLNQLLNISLLFIIAASLLTSCFPEDEQQPLIPFTGVIGSTYNSIYTHQSYYSFSDSSEVSYNLNAAWDLGFEAAASGEHVILNNSDFLRVANLGAIDFDQYLAVPDNALWLYNASSGNFDSLSIMNWVNTRVSPYEYTYNVYILGRVGDYGIEPLKKFQLTELTGDHYTITVDNLDNSKREILVVNKKTNLNFIKVGIRNNAQVVQIEPDNNVWDIQFTQYEDSIPDDSGVLYPYVLRGAFINDTKIEVAKYYISTDEVPANESDPNKESNDLKNYFESNSIKPMADSLYSSDWDAIGWEWKDVTVDEAANTAVYKADTRRIYLIKDLLNGKNYKLRFFSYYSNGVVGYPWFQYVEVN